MIERERMHQNTTEQRSETERADGPEDGDNLEAIRADADRLFAVADRAYEQIRGHDSEERLRRNRQRGGQ